MADLETAAARFKAALQASGAGKAGDQTFERLVSHYGESSRHYHNLRHITHCLDGLEEFRGQAQHPQEVALALWFHDAIYNPKAKDNEEKSAQLARRELQDLGIPSDCIERICIHILATKHHQAEHEDSRLVIDLDLSILAVSRARYEEFETQIRQEYAHVPGVLFRFARRKVLRGFLDKKNIYALSCTRLRWEQPARENLLRALSS